jgi:HK97 gp10 family phage protein
MANVTFIPNLAVGKEWELSLEALRCVTIQGQKVQDAAKALVPVDTGFLRDSIDMAVEGGTTTANAEIGATAPYGGFVEYGTSTNPAQPYMRPALDTIAGG